MLYSSTRGNEKSVNFEDVLLKGLADDGGLYVPDKIPFLNFDKIKELRDLEYYQLVHKITKYFVQPIISSSDYLKICKKTYENFSKEKLISITDLERNEFLLNLYHGPTFAFKDFALQLLGNIYDYILKKKKINLTVIGATSGDTGSAAISGCCKSEYVNIFILFPNKKVSDIQRKQMTTINKKNVFNIAVKGNFDDCQNIVKSLFNRNKKKSEINLAAVNSINWVRIMGQIVYYFWSYLKCAKKSEQINFCVPTGNFGNVYAGYIAKKMGLPIKKLFVASNSNDVLTRFFATGVMQKFQTIKTISPSMDIQISSNFERLLYDYIKDEKKNVSNFFRELSINGKFNISKKLLKKILMFFSGGKLSDKMTKNMIKNLYENYGIIVDPHTAVGIGVGRALSKKQEKTIYLATAHYGKFINTINESLNRKNQLPLALKKLNDKKEKFNVFENDIQKIEQFIFKNI